MSINLRNLNDKIAYARKCVESEQAYLNQLLREWENATDPDDSVIEDQEANLLDAQDHLDYLLKQKAEEESEASSIEEEISEARIDVAEERIAMEKVEKAYFRAVADGVDVSVRELEIAEDRFLKAFDRLKQLLQKVE